MKKITFLTGHNWKSNRLGGFHKFAEACCNAGMEVIFFSFPRPYYSYFMHQELYNYKTIKALKKGLVYNVGSSTLTNVTLPTLKLPNKAGKFLSDRIMNALERFSFGGFKRFAKKWFTGTDVFVFESCDGMIYLDTLKKMFPDAKMIYRPSDPLMYDGALRRYVTNETNMLKKADMNLIVNKEGLELYKRKVSDFEASVKYQLLSNGVDIESYEKTYPVPQVLDHQYTILYVGAWEVEWNLLFRAAYTNPEFHYVVVCPNYPSEEIQNEVNTYTNLTYVPGIPPEEVPAWITNCSVVMVPYVTDFYKNRPLGVTAKYYQAMAAHKPIVAYCDTPKLTDAGAAVTYTYDDFIKEVQKAVKEGLKSYKFDLGDRQWSNICEKFISYLN